MSPQKRKISFCTVCKNNEDLLKYTLPVNIRDNKDADPEFIIIDCSETSELETWIKRELASYLENRKLIYYKLSGASTFTYVQAKNKALESAGSEILCYINAGDYTGKRFAQYIINQFKRHDNIVLFTPPLEFHSPTTDHPPGMIIGKLCIKRTDFHSVNGFDERMIKFGNEDIDIINRLQMTGIKAEQIVKPAFRHHIYQQPGMRFSLYKYFNLAAIYISHHSPCKSEVIFMYEDNHFEKGILTNNAVAFAKEYKYSFVPRLNRYTYNLTGIENRGKWKADINNNSILFCYSDTNKFNLKTQQKNRYDILQDTHTSALFYEVDDPAMIEKLLTLNSIFYNTKIMTDNMAFTNKKSIFLQSL